MRTALPIVLLLLLGLGAGAAQRAPIGPLYGPVPVSAVLDGDTLEVASNVGPRRVRLIGVDAPELGQPSPLAAAFGVPAALALRGLLPVDHLVWLELDLGLEDVYGRLLAYAYVADAEGDWILGEVRARQLNLAMVEAGWATSLLVPPNQRYADLYLAAEEAARAAERGMWGAEPPPSGSRLDLAPLPEGPIVIECVLYNPTTPNDEAGEWVGLWLRQPLDTRGYRVFDAGSGQSFHLPPGLQPMGELRVPNPGQGVWNNDGDTIYLMLGERMVDRWDYSDQLAPPGSIVCRGHP